MRALAVIGLFVVAAALVVVLTHDRFDVAGFTTPGSQSAGASARLHRALGYDPEPGMVVLARTPSGFGAAAPRLAVGRLAARIAADPAVGRVETAFGPEGLPVLTSRDRRGTLLLIHFRSVDPNTLAGPIDRLSRLREPGLRLRHGGYVVGELDLSRDARSDLVRAELIAFPLLALLVLLIFRGVVAAAVPVVIGGIAVLGTFACLRLLSHVTHISIFALNLAVLLGLGLAVDYGLILVSRYREEAASRGVGPEAAWATLATAGRTVAFSASAVAGACAPLLLFSQGFVHSMGIAGVLVAPLAAGAALVAVPPLLVVAGQRIMPRHAARPAGGPGRWGRWARWVMRRPVDLALIGVLLLVAAAAPALQAKATFPDLTAVPPGDEARAVADDVARNFTPFLDYPVNIAVRVGPGGRAAFARRAGALDLVPGVAAVRPAYFAPDGTAFVQAVLAQGPFTPESAAVVQRLRGSRLHLAVGGRTAEFLDLRHSIGHRAPLAIALVVLTTLLVLFGLTRSVLLPVKAVAFHALVLGAVFGLLVLIFQRHALDLSGLVSYRGPPALELTITIVIIASTFGLATDYSIILLSRVTEEHEAGHTDADAVARAIERTGPIITSSAILLAVALLALTSSRVFLVKQLTVGQVLGVSIDVTVVRLVLVPAFIRVLGPLNWWAPRPLRRRVDSRPRGRQESP